MSPFDRPPNPGALDPDLGTCTAEFSLLRRQFVSLQSTVQSSFQPFAPLPWSPERDKSGPHVHYHAVVKQRLYKLKAEAGSPWIGRQLIIELADWESGAVYAGPACVCGEAAQAAAAAAAAAAAGLSVGASSRRTRTSTRLSLPFVQAGHGLPRAGLPLSIYIKLQAAWCRPLPGTSVETRVDAVGETACFALDACRCLRDASFELRLRDPVTGHQPRGRIKLQLVRCGAMPGAGCKAERERATSQATLEGGAGPASPLPPPASGPATPRRSGALPAKHGPGELESRHGHEAAPALKRARAGPLDFAPLALIWESAGLSEASLPSPPAPSSSRRPRSPSGRRRRPAFGTPEPPPLLPYPLQLPPPPPLPPALPGSRQGSEVPGGREEAEVLQEAGYLDSLLSAFARSAPARDRRSVADLLSSAEEKFWELFVSAELRGEGSSSRGAPPPPAVWGVAVPAEMGRGAGRGAGPVALPEADVEALFVKLSSLAINSDAPAPAPVPLVPGSPAPFDEPPPPPPPLPPPVPFSPPPYILSPHEEDEFMRRVTAAEAAGAGSALAVLLGDPRVLGTPLFRTLAGRIRTRHLFVLVRIAVARSSGPGWPRASFPPPSFDSILSSLALNLLAGPSSYPTLEEAERACENIWNFVIVVTSDFVVISPNFMLLPLEEVLALHERAIEIAMEAVERFGRDVRTELLATTAKVRAGFSLRQFGHVRAALELQFEAWDALLRLRVYPHRLECEVLRDLCELHVQIERPDLARHFSERLYWFEETDDDTEFKASCLQTLAYIDWHEGDPAAAAEGYRRAADIARELAERSGGNPAYVMRLGRASRSASLAELAAGLVARWGRSLRAGTQALDAVCEVTSSDHDDFCLAACGVVFRPGGFKLRHAIRIVRSCLLLFEAGLHGPWGPTKVASALYHIGLLCALDGQLAEALDTFVASMAKYTCTPELAACFGDSHPRIRNLRRAATWVAARLGRPVPPQLVHPYPYDANERPRGLAGRMGGLGLAWRPALDPDFWASRGIDSELQEVFLATYPADTVLQISAWLANGPA
eukprot:tig00000403_g360.t1